MNKSNQEMIVRHLISILHGIRKNDRVLIEETIMALEISKRNSPGDQAAIVDRLEDLARELRPPLLILGGPGGSKSTR